MGGEKWVVWLISVGIFFVCLIDCVSSHSFMITNTLLYS